MNTSNGAQAQIWNYVSGGNQEWNLVRVDASAAQTNTRADEAHGPEPVADALPAQAPERSRPEAEQRGQGPRCTQITKQHKRRPAGQTAGRLFE